MLGSRSLPRRRCAFTLVELLAIILVAVIVVAIMLPAMNPPRVHNRQLKCSTQARSVVQAMVTWANNNQGNYPLPSLLDVENNTVAEQGSTKDTSANFLSLLIFNGHISAEILVSPSESSPNIETDTDYQLTNPTAAVNPEKAMWDPAFNADFTDPARKGNLSYAHLPPAGPRLERWKDTFVSTEAVFGNRGPRYQGTTYPTSGRWTLTNDQFGTGSNTLLIHGGRSTWEGNIGYNDGHVSFETKPNPDYVTYQRTVVGKPKPVPTPDNFFVDEYDDAVGNNAFLSIFKTAGPSTADFKAIWD